MFLSLRFIADNIELFQTNSGLQSINTKHEHDLHSIELMSVVTGEACTMHEPNCTVSYLILRSQYKITQVDPEELTLSCISNFVY
jgi:hypothetical protein